MDKDVSIIIPAYNCEKYVGRCIESVVTQTLFSLQILLIDDGSSDSTGDIADEYASSDSRIQVIRQANGGVSSARNTGLKLAKGKYVGFVDSDDYIEPDMFEKLFFAAKSAEADIAACSYFVEDGQKQYLYQMEDVSFDIQKYGLDQYLLKNVLIHPVLWNKIYRREVLMQNQLQFYMNAGEDFLFNIEYAPYANRTVNLKEPLYHYVQRKDSIMHSVRKSNAGMTMLEMFNIRIAPNSIYRAQGSPFTDFYLFAAMFAGMMFSPAVVKQPRAFFQNQLNKAAHWDRITAFAECLLRTDNLVGLYQNGVMSARFYAILRRVFFLFLQGKQRKAASYLYLLSRLILLKKWYSSLPPFLG